MKDHVKIFKALANETRLSIMVLLREQELCVCQIEKALKISQAKASRHLTVLKNAGLVKSRSQGLWMYYRRLKPDNRALIIADKLLRDLVACEGAREICAARIPSCAAAKTKKRKR